jgi:4-amino-4-deoxy-L-arabinose transferase-like glycosyltransferase
MTKAVKHSLLIVAVGCLAFLTNLGATDLWDEDEGFFGGCAAEMYAHHDWIVPRFNGEVFSHKPPFMYWMMMLGFETFGVSPFAARIGSALAGIATALVTYHLGRRLFCAEVGLWAGLIMCSGLMFNVVARAATPDCYLVLFFTLALYLYSLRSTIAENIAAGSAETDLPNAPANARATRPTMPSLGVSALLYTVMGLAVLVKGPIGFLLPMAGIGLYLLCTSPRSELPAEATRLARWQRNLAPFGPLNFLRCLWSMKPLLAMAIVLLVAGPWFVCVAVQTNGQFPAEFFGVHNFGRFMHAMEQHRGTPLYYPVMIALGFFPWSVFALPTALDLIRRVRSQDRWSDGCILLVCWAAVIVGLFTLAGTKLPNYVLPAYPALALLTACFLHRWMHVPRAVPSWQPRLCLGLLVVVGAACLIGFPFVAQWHVQGQLFLAKFQTSQALIDELPTIGLLGLFPFLGGAIALYFSQRGRPQASLVATALVAVLFSTGLLAFAAVRIDRLQYTAKIARAIVAASGNRPLKVAQYRNSRPSLTFYVQRPVATMRKRNDAIQFLSSSDDTLLVTTSQQYPDLQASLPADVVVLAEEPQFPKQGSVLLLGREQRLSQRPESLRR